MCFGDRKGALGQDRESILDNFFLDHLTYFGDVEYDLYEIRLVIKLAQKIIAAEPTVLEIDPPCTVIGDIHGQYEDLHRIFAVLRLHESNACSTRLPFLFLGDYVDRGRMSLECICCLLICKIKFPKKFFLLRGNHESPEINEHYGFLDELRRRFQADGRKLFRAFNRLFSFLPLAARIGQKILCIHGGFGPSFSSLDDIRMVRRPIRRVCDHKIATDMLWSDPMVQLQGYIHNSLRQMSVFYGENIVLDVCRNMEVDLIVRGHQLMANGYSFFCGRKLVTIFSAPRHVQSLNNRAAVLTVTKDLRVGITLIGNVTPMSQGISKFEEHYERHKKSFSYGSYLCRESVAAGVLNEPSGEEPTVYVPP